MNRDLCCSQSRPRAPWARARLRQPPAEGTPRPTDTALLTESDVAWLFPARTEVPPGGSDFWDRLVGSSILGSFLVPHPLLSHSFLNLTSALSVPEAWGTVPSTKVMMVNPRVAIGSLGRQTKSDVTLN